MNPKRNYYGAYGYRQPTKQRSRILLVSGSGFRSFCRLPRVSYRLLCAFGLGLRVGGFGDKWALVVYVSRLRAQV